MDIERCGRHARYRCKRPCTRRCRSERRSGRERGRGRKGEEGSGRGEEGSGRGGREREEGREKEDAPQRRWSAAPLLQRGTFTSARPLQIRGDVWARQGAALRAGRGQDRDQRQGAQGPAQRALYGRGRARAPDPPRGVNPNQRAANAAQLMQRAWSGRMRAYSGGGSGGDAQPVAQQADQYVALDMRTVARPLRTRCRRGRAGMAHSRAPFPLPSRVRPCGAHSRPRALPFPFLSPSFSCPSRLRARVRPVCVLV